MDFNATIDIILKDLREVREIIDDLKNYPDVPAIQIEMAKSKCKSAEEVISLLKTMKPSETGKKADAGVMPEHAKDIEPAKKELEKLIEISGEGNEEEIPIKTQALVSEKKGETAIVADKFAGAQNTILDKFGSADKEDDISSVIKTKHVDKLSDAIGVNDKFLFIREIFSGSRPAYDEAISRLEKADSYADARAIIMSYSGTGEENGVVKQLLDIVKRKLPSDG